MTTVNRGACSRPAAPAAQLAVVPAIFIVGLAVALFYILPFLAGAPAVRRLSETFDVSTLSDIASVPTHAAEFDAALLRICTRARDTRQCDMMRRAGILDTWARLRDAPRPNAFEREIDQLSKGATP